MRVSVTERLTKRLTHMSSAGAEYLTQPNINESIVYVVPKLIS